VFKKVDQMCIEVAKDPILRAAGAINLIGTSQGGMVARGFVERCNDPPVLNFVSWVSPQGGQYGVPGYLNTTIGNLLDKVAGCCIYDEFWQNAISFAGYWRGTNLNLDSLLDFF
jgi:palmitoyl-protein thioesterase